MPANEQDIRYAGLPAGDRHRGGEARDVDAVGDHLVIAWEEAVDEMTGRRAHGDAPVEPRSVSTHDPAAELVRGREARVGVEGRDVDAAGLAQQEERQEGHEWLVEVEQVEAFAFEQVADLADVARRERQGPDRPVGRHADADPDPQDVTLGRSLRSVAGGDDPDVVATQPQVLVQEPDVLGHASRFGVDVGTDQPDLHGWRRPSGGGGSKNAGSSKRGGRWRPPG